MTATEVRNRLDIIEVAERYGVRLVRRGRYWWGRCPFHPNRGRPSLAVEPQSQSWICFECGGWGNVPDRPSPQWGDVIAFIGRMEHLDQSEVIRRANADFISTQHGPDLAPVDERHQAYTAFLSAASLLDPHRALLHRAGLDDVAIQRSQYKSLPDPADRAPLAAMRACLSDHAAIPGVQKGRWDFDAPAGLIVPIRNRQGRIHMLQIRSDTADGRARHWLTRPDGKAWSGISVVSLLHVAGREYWESGWPLWLTDDPLQADVAAHHLRQTVLALPDMTHWREVLPAILAFHPGEVVAVFDVNHPGGSSTDERRKHRLIQALKNRRARVLEARIPEGQGVGEWLTAGKRPVLRWAE